MTEKMDYKEIINSVATMDVDSLVELFNKQVGNSGWTSARAAFDKAVIDAFVKHGIDVSAVFSGGKLSFKNKIALSEDKSKIIILN